MCFSLSLRDKFLLWHSFDTIDDKKRGLGGLPEEGAVARVGDSLHAARHEDRLEILVKHWNSKMDQKGWHTNTEKHKVLLIH